MKVILIEDVKKVGKKGDVVEVADGYGRNYLIRNKLAVMASATSQEVLHKQQAKSAALHQQHKAEAEALALRLAEITLKFPMKTGAEGKVFGSVSTKQISEELQKQFGITIDKRKIIDASPLTSLGINKVSVELFKDVIGTINVHLVAED